MTIETTILNDLDWREKELASLKRIARSQVDESVAQKALLRALLAMLYAHYEGFCKFALDCYLEEIERSGLARFDCKDPISMFSLSSELRQSKNLVLNDHFHFCTTVFSGLLAAPITFSDRIETSNLYPSILIELCDSLCLNQEAVRDNEFELRALVGRRNKIAHGEKQEIRKIEDYEVYERKVIQVMNEIALLIVYSVENSSYKK